MNKIIYLDVDNTIFASEYQVAYLYNEYYRLPLQDKINPNEVTKYNMGIEEEIVEKIFNRGDFYSTTYLYDDMKKVLLKIKEQGYKIFAYSKGGLENISHKSIFLKEEIGDLLEGWLFIGSKDYKIDKAGWDMTNCILIDDHIKNLNNDKLAYRICPKLTVKNVDWNKDFTEDINKGNFIMNRWTDLLKIIDIIENIETMEGD